MKNEDLGKTQITDKIRVSSAAIFYEEWFGKYYQIETWIFSTDPRIKSTMVIHGTCSHLESSKLVDTCKKVHGYMANNLLSKFKQNEN